MYPEALLFDMDGVLVDSTESWRSALNESLRNYDQAELTRKEFLDNYWGGDLFDILDRLGLDLGIGRFCNSVYSKYAKTVKIFPKTLQTLQKLNGYEKAIVTNTTYDCTKKILDRLDIAKYFKTIVTSDQVKHGKPHPDMIFLACERLGKNVNDVILIGDTVADLKAGKEAGCHVVGIGMEADHRLESVSELPDYLKKIKN